MSFSFSFIFCFISSFMLEPLSAGVSFDSCCCSLVPLLLSLRHSMRPGKCSPKHQSHYHLLHCVFRDLLLLWLNGLSRSLLFSLIFPYHHVAPLLQIDEILMTTLCADLLNC